MRKTKLYAICMALLLCISFFNIQVLAEQPPELPEVEAGSYVLFEPDSGKILYAKNENQKMYPASMTKILTAILAMEYIGLDEIIIAGEEVGAIPYDSSKAGHVAGEAITGRNIIRGLIIPSGNETACIVAMTVAKKTSGEETLTYAKAEKIFRELMNKKAKELGAVNSNFVNPHGYHDENHYSTVYDIALITKEAMKYDFIMQAAKETAYSGFSAEGNDDPSLKSVSHEWTSHNELIKDGPYAYKYATGMKTGFTDEAGICLSATATKNGTKLIAVTSNPAVIDNLNPIRWVDAKNLFDYGFDNFAIETVVSYGDVLGEVLINNPRLGDAETLSYLSVNTVKDFLSKEQPSKIAVQIVFDPELVAVNEPDKQTGITDNLKRLTAPITKGQVIGTVSYTLDGKLIFTGDVTAANEVLPRTFNSDVDYYIAKTKAAITSKAAIPYWIILVLVLIIVILLIFMIRGKRNRGVFK